MSIAAAWVLSLTVWAPSGASVHVDIDGFASQAECMRAGYRYVNSGNPLMKAVAAETLTNWGAWFTCENINP